ncbi:GntR family transcriptional regulator [Streptomyces sp. NPDC056132]|uniref:GntR family transcriptional regulator n=1 Tax=Streptomyces sp. NPDC056132 TaxID=3345722 RepID=UPI0035D8558F
MAGETGAQRPKYQRIADDLKAAIERGEYGPGDRLPGESALAAQYGVAPLTARQALKILRTEGLVETKRGAGARVISFQALRRHGIERIARQQWGTGKSIWSHDDDRPMTVETSVDSAPAPVHIAKILKLEEGELVCTRSRRFVVQERPVQLSTSYLPYELVAGSAIMRVDTGEGGTYARLTELGHAPVRAKEEVRSRLPTAVEAEGLAMPLERPVIKLCRTVFDTDGRAVEVNEMTLDSAAYILDYTFDL